MYESIRLAHGFGGKLTLDLLNDIIHPALTGNASHAMILDAAVVDDVKSPLVISTDSFTVSPRFFPGGDIGKLAVAGTINDIAMMGALPRYLALGLIIEEGFSIEELRRIIQSIGEMCRITGTEVITGDTKVVEKGAVDGIFINTTGIGTQIIKPIGPDCIREGDAIIISGTIGDHGAAILNTRENLGFSHTIFSDCAPLSAMITGLGAVVGTNLHALRDPTRGGIAATLNEFALDTGLQFLLEEEKLPVRPEIQSFVEILGLDLLTLANEGKALIVITPEAVKAALHHLHGDPNGKDAAVIGHVEKCDTKGRVLMETVIGTHRIIEMPLEAGLPRIC
jgi:hydrogenase expression/formation protein HypE